MAQYTVAQGDTLSKIASQNNTTVADLAKLNNIQDVNKINVGQKLNLTSTPVQPTTPIAVNNLTGATPQPIKITQPQPATTGALLQSDIISKGQADTARAVAEEARIAAQQGTKAPTATADVLKGILGVSTQTTPTTPSTATTTAPTVDNTMSTTNANGITQDTLASQRQGIQDTLNNVMGETRLTANEYAGTVDPAKQELNQINQQMNEEALAARRRTEAVLQIPGITKEQAQDKINEISRVNASKLADLAVVQMAKQGAYDSAKEIADRAVQAKVEDQKNKLNALMFTYTENKELFTKAEQRAFEVAQDDRKRKLDAEEKNLQRISDLSLEALKDGAPASVVTKMRNAKTEAEAISIGGQYIGATDRAYKKAQTAKIYAEIAKDRATADAKKKGLVLTPVTAAQAQNKVQQITDLTKGGASAVGTSIITRSPSGFWGTVGKIATVVGIPALVGDAYNKMTGKQQDFIAGVEQLRSGLNLDELINAKARGATFGALSDQEMKVLSNSASKLGTWAIKDSNGNVVGYNTSEKNFRNELDKINNYAKLDYLYRGGNPADVGVFQLQDGRYATKNNDGTIEVLEINK